MTDIAIRVDNLGKMYRIGVREKRADTLRETLGNLAASPFEYLRRTLRGPSEEEIIWALKGVSFAVQRGEVVGIPSLRQAQYKRRAQDKHWSQRGGEEHAYFDRLSTRLKILSRITEPTEGRAEIHGRVGSLLEACPECNRRVGTGFHPTPLCPPASKGKAGRENIYLNGAIPSTMLRPALSVAEVTSLGMKKAETCPEPLG